MKLMEWHESGITHPGSRSKLMCPICWIIAVLVLLSCILMSSAAGRGAVTDPSVTHDLELLNKLWPLKEEPYIMLWRPQKVGSSTILSLLMSTAYRYNIVQRRKGVANQLCAKISFCSVDDNPSLSSSRAHQQLSLSIAYSKKRLKWVESVQEQLRHQMSNSHQMCNLHHEIVSKYLHCAFTKNNSKNQEHGSHSTALAAVKEILIVRDPLARISAYYFWGELYRMALRRSIGGKGGTGGGGAHKQGKVMKNRLGLQTERKEIPKDDFNLFAYHGDETTVPPLHTAINYARDLPLGIEVKGRPTFTWAAFANNANDTVSILATDRIMTIVTERLDESLVVLSHFMNCSLADVVVTVPRKALSAHPKHSDWPDEAVAMIRSRLEQWGEYRVYDAANKKLTARVNRLKAEGVDVDGEISILVDLRNRVANLCLSDEYLERYRKKIAGEGFEQHRSSNKLRDVADKYIEGGHSFSFNGELLYSFDVCGPCEAHAMLAGMRAGLATSVKGAPTLMELRSMDPKYTKDDVNFLKCP